MATFHAEAGKSLTGSPRTACQRWGRGRGRHAATIAPQAVLGAAAQATVQEPCTTRPHRAFRPVNGKGAGSVKDRLHPVPNTRERCVRRD